MFIDETWASTNLARKGGRCRRGRRLRAAVPHGHYKTITLVAGLRLSGLVAQKAFDRPINGLVRGMGGKMPRAHPIARRDPRHGQPLQPRQLRAGGTDLRRCATSCGCASNSCATQTALGAFYRRLSARVGKAKAVTATAGKIATLFYNTLRHGIRRPRPFLLRGQISRPGYRQPPTTREVSRLHAARDAGANVVSQESPRTPMSSNARTL